MTARVVHTSRRSIGVHVSLRARGAKRLSESEVLSAYMTFVPVDARKGQVEPVKSYTPTTPRDRALHREGELRREFRQKLAAGDFPEEAGRARVARERMSLRTLARDVRRIVQDTGRSNACSPELSYVHRVEPVMAGSLNVHGTLYGGTLMRWIENAASLSARAFTDTSMIVVGVHGLDFLKPVSRDVFLHTHAMAVRADQDSVTIRVEVTSENPMTGSVEQNQSGYFTYRALDRRATVPKLILQSDAEHALSAESTHHLAFARRLRAQ
jgi:acyl-CoA hydrolase